MRRTLLVTVIVYTASAHAILRLKLHFWFPQYEYHWITQAAGCKQRIENYLITNRTAACPDPCACAADCILNNLPPTIQSNLASAQVLLGLGPAVLVYFGPDLAEIAALSTYRPLLAILLSLGSPAINVRRIFRCVELREPFVQPVSASARLWSAWISCQSTRIRRIVRSLSYVCALAAIVNNVHNSVYTDLRTISGWRCGAVMMPLGWSLGAVVVHTWSMIAIRLRTKNKHMPAIRSLIQSTVFLDLPEAGAGVICEVLLWLASLSAVIHLTFGILVLSSLVFISTIEAVQVLVRYAASALMCQFVLLLELAMMRCELSREHEGQTNRAISMPAAQSELVRPHTI